MEDIFVARKVLGRTSESRGSAESGFYASFTDFDPNEIVRPNERKKNLDRRGSRSFAEFKGLFREILSVGGHLGNSTDTR